MFNTLEDKIRDAVGTCDDVKLIRKALANVRRSYPAPANNRVEDVIPKLPRDHAFLASVLARDIGVSTALVRRAAEKAGARHLGRGVFQFVAAVAEAAE